MNSAELYSLVLMLLTALGAGLIGSFALMKRMSLAGDVVSHIALPGLGLALLFHINPLIGAAAALLLGTFLIWHLQKGGTLTTDVAIGVIFTAALAIGTLVTPSEDLIEALFGGFQSLNFLWLLLGFLAVLTIVVFTFTFRHQLILTLFSPELAAATGVDVSRLNLPAAIGRQLTHTLTAFLLSSSVASALSVGIGFFVSRSYPHFAIGRITLNLAPGPAIISVATFFFLLSLIRKKV